MEKSALETSANIAPAPAGASSGATPQVFCPECGYDLQAIASDRCPECGLAIDRSRLGESTIPWVHRKQIGRIRAFYRTVKLATFSPREFAKEMSRAAHFRDAVLFRRVAVCCALAPIGVVLTIGYLYALANFQVYMVLRAADLVWSRDDLLGSVLQMLGVPLIWICLAMFLFACTGVCSYFFHPKELSVVRQNRAIALSYYACGPLAWSPIVMLLAVGGSVLSALSYEYKFVLDPVLLSLLILITWLPLLLLLIAIVRAPVVLIGATTHQTGRKWLLGFVLPVAWIVLAILILVLIPLACALLALMFVSFRSWG